MEQLTVGFIGLGLIGGSIAKALRRTMPSIRLIACNRSRKSLTMALEDGTLNHASDSIDSSFKECDFIFLGMPVSLNIEYLKKLKEILPESCMITDVGSVKGSIQQAAARLGMQKRFIGGHPMAGSERTGYQNASDRLLENAWYILTPFKESPPEKVAQLRKLVEAAGAIPVVIDYQEHDRAAAAVSHLPHIIAFSLVNLIRTADNKEGLMRQLAAGGFRDITRIASSSPQMWESICLENKEPILQILQEYQDSLSQVADAIRGGEGSRLEEFFTEAKNYRDDMPTRMHGSLNPAYEIYTYIPDESGAIATIATILAANGVSIKNISVIHNREFEDGVLRVEFYREEALEKAVTLLNRHSYKIRRRS